MRSLLVVVAALAVSPLAHAQLLCHSDSHASSPTNWVSTLVVPSFDPSLGQLSAVRLSLFAEATGSYQRENLAPAPITATAEFSAAFDVSAPGGPSFVTAEPEQHFSDTLAAFDGTIDFAGPSGVTHAGIVVSTTSTAVLTTPADLAWFVSSSPTVSLDARANGTSVTTGSGGLIVTFSQDARATLEVCYEYVPFVRVTCAGDGSGAACPCGNESAPLEGRGCLHSAGSGTSLRASGAASLSSDTLSLAANDVTGTSALFFQGTVLANGGAGAVFGDGLRCAAGSVVRLSIESTSGGSAHYPAPGGASVSQRGHVLAPGVRHYQAWYRNSAVFCTGATFNLSNALTVDWQV